MKQLIPIILIIGFLAFAGGKASQVVNGISIKKIRARKPSFRLSPTPQLSIPLEVDIQNQNPNQATVNSIIGNITYNGFPIAPLTTQNIEMLAPLSTTTFEFNLNVTVDNILTQFTNILNNGGGLPNLRFEGRANLANGAFIPLSQNIINIG